MKCKLKDKTLSILSEELDKKTLKKASDFIDLTVESDAFKHEFAKLTNNKDDMSNNKVRDEKILTLILLGMGRNRTISILKDYSVNRKIFESVRDYFEVNSSKMKADNEKIITNFKWETKTRKSRLDKLKDVDWDEVCNRYLSGEAIYKIAKDVNVKPRFIQEQLIDDELYDETRHSHYKKKIAEENIDKVDNQVIKNIVNNNPLDGKDVLWKKTKEVYPWILRRQFFDKLIELDLERTVEDVNEIKRIKSKTNSNTSYMIKVNSQNAIKEVFGSIDNLVERYMNDELGSYKKIADKVSKENSSNYEVSEKQIVKTIINHPKYKKNNRRISRAQRQLYNFVKETFKGVEVVEEYPWGENRKLDIYIPYLKIGIEFNGEYWHSNKVIQENYSMSAYDYHKQRALDAKEKGIKLIYVWEKDWKYKYSEVEEAIKNKLWDEEILNKYTNELEQRVKDVIFEILKKADVNYEIENETIKLLDSNIVIDTEYLYKMKDKDNSKQISIPIKMFIEKQH